MTVEVCLSVAHVNFSKLVVFSRSTHNYDSPLEVQSSFWVDRKNSFLWGSREEKGFSVKDNVLFNTTEGCICFRATTSELEKSEKLEKMVEDYPSFLFSNLTFIRRRHVF